MASLWFRHRLRTIRLAYVLVRTFFAFVFRLIRPRWTTLSNPTQYASIHVIAPILIKEFQFLNSQGLPYSSPYIHHHHHRHHHHHLLLLFQLWWSFLVRFNAFCFSWNMFQPLPPTMKNARSTRSQKDSIYRYNSQANRGDSQWKG